MAVSGATGQRAEDPGRAGSSATARVAEFVASTRYGDLPVRVLEVARRLVLDTIGCAMGAVPTRYGTIVRRLVDDYGGQPQATVIGTGQRAPSFVAAYANARLANVLDYDDTFMTLGHHANASLAAALAAAEPLALDGRRFTAAFAVGFEVGARVARAATPLHELDDQGRAARILFPGPAIGTYAACAAAAHAWGLTPAQTEQAFGICAHYVPLAVPWGGRAGAHDGSLPGIKYEDEGWVAQAGMMAARLARDGVTGSPRILDHGGGLWTSLQRAAPDVDALTEGLGRRWWLVSTSFKPWPCCRWIHYALTAFARILQPERLTAGEIEEIWFYTHPQAYTNFDRQEIGPDVVLDASFSYPHAAAMVALGVPPGPDWFASDVVRSPQAAALRRRVFVGTEPRALDPAAWGNDRGIRRVPTRAVVKARGVVFTETADTALGDPWEGAPAFTDSALIEKFRRLARSLAPASREWQARAEDSIQRLLTVDEIRDVRELTRLLSPAPEPA